MTLEDFISPIWTGGLKLRYEDKNYDVNSVDFKDRTVQLIRGKDTFTVSYTLVDLITECNWYKEDNENAYSVSECGFDFIFIDDRDNLTQHSFNHCPKCGKKIKENENV